MNRDSLGARKATDGPAGGAGPSPKKARRSNNPFLRAWAWKREGRPDKVRFHQPYLHTIELPDGSSKKLSIKQAKFEAEGFASTVWDSSIVAARYIEHTGTLWKGRRVLDLSAGCGLVALTLASLGAEVTATDLSPNLPLLRENATRNGLQDRVAILEHVWGTDSSSLDPPFDVIFACDTMYMHEAVPALVRTLDLCSSNSTEVVVAYGRNRQAEEAFLDLARGSFCFTNLSSRQLHPDFQTVDVTVTRLRRKRPIIRRPGTPSSSRPGAQGRVATGEEGGTGEAGGCSDGDVDRDAAVEGDGDGGAEAGCAGKGAPDSPRADGGPSRVADMNGSSNGAAISGRAAELVRS